MRTARAYRPRMRLAIVVAALAGLLTLAPAQAATSTQNNPKAQREEVRKRKVQVAGELDALKATTEELQDALDTLDENLRLEQAALESAQAAVEQASAEADAIRRQEAETQAKIDALKALMTSVAVSTYARPPIDDKLVAMASTDINEAVRKQALLDIVNNANRDLSEQYRAARADLDVLEKARNDALARAEAAKADVQARVTTVATAQGQQQKIYDAVEDRVDRLLSESSSLAARDKALSDQIQREAAAAAAAAAKARKSSGGSRGPINVPSSAELVNVQGIIVHSSIAKQLGNLLNAADAAGLNLGGSGYRDINDQIALRRAHCGTSDYDIYQKPAFQCRPPTARPGTSNHERGLAVDFTWNGSIVTRGTKAFAWLQANAGRYGFRNLPSEPWHWSPDGN